MRVYVLFHDTTETTDNGRLPRLFFHPMLHNGLDIEIKLLTRSPEKLRRNLYAYDEQMLREVDEFKPDIIVYSPWETIPHRLFEEAHARNIPTIGLYWDTRMELGKFELDIFQHCNYVAVADSLATYYRLSLLGKLMHRNPHEYGTIFCSGYLITKDDFPKQDRPKKYDVLLLGSLEASRIGLVDRLKADLAQKNIGFTQMGGIIPGARHLDHDEYIAALNEAKILLCSQTQPARLQIKNKVYEFLSCGGFCLVDRNYEYESVIPGDCVAYYDDYDDMVAKIAYFMAHPAERDAIAARGHRWYNETYDIAGFWRRTLNAIKAYRGETIPAPSVLRADNHTLVEDNPTYRFVENEIAGHLNAFGWATVQHMDADELVRALLRKPDADDALLRAGYQYAASIRIRQHIHLILVKLTPLARKILPRPAFRLLRGGYYRVANRIATAG